MSFRLCKKVLLLGLLLSIFYSLSASGGQLPFFPGSFSQLQQQAEINRTPYLVYFYVAECEGCTKMSKETFNHAGLVQFVSQNYMAYKVDGLDFINGIDIATKYGVTKFPTTILFGPDGNIRDRTSGFLNTNVMLTMLRNGIKESDNSVSSRSIVSRSSSPITMRTADASTTNKYSSQVGSSSPPSFSSGARTSEFGDFTETNPSSSFFNPQTSILSAETDPPATTQRKPASLTDNERKEYIKSYMENRMKVSQPNSGYRYDTGNSTTGYYNNPQSTSSPTGWVSSGNSYVDDYSRATLKEAAENGYYPSTYYTDPPKWGSNGTGYSSVNTSANNYGNVSYVDDQVRANPALATQGQDQNPYNNTYRSEGPSRGEPSFLDNVDGSSNQRWAQDQNQYYRSGDVFLKGEADYAIDKDGRWVALYDLDPSTSLSKVNGEFYIVSPTTQDGQMASAGQRRDQDTYNYGTPRGAEPTPKAVMPVVRRINPSVPGLADYSPEDVTDNTFGVIIGDFVSLNKLKHALEEFEENSDETAWVYGEKINDRHHYKLVMGEYRGEQEAVSAALRMGASWENIKVVNLAKL